MRRVLTWGILAVVLVASLAAGSSRHAQARSNGTPVRATQLTSDAQVDAYLTASQFHGYILLARRGKTILSKGYGMADVEHHVPNTRQSRWPMFGIESFLTAIATLKLQEEGKLRVQDKLCRYIAACPPAWQPITLEHVLLGASGLSSNGYDMFGDPGSLSQSVAACKSRPLTHAPGVSADDDSACNRVLLSIVLAKVAGQPFGAVLQQTIVRPAGLTNTRLASGTRAPAWSVRGYIAGTLAPSVYVSGYPLIYASPEDVQRLDGALLAGKILTPHSLRMLFAPRSCTSVAGGVPTCVGYGVQVAKANRFPTFSLAPATVTSPLKTNRVISQGSGGPDGAGFSIQNLFSPDDGAVAILLVNDPGFYPGDNEDGFRDHTVQLLWAK